MAETECNNARLFGPEYASLDATLRRSIEAVFNWAWGGYLASKAVRVLTRMPRIE
ncbi:MAG: hypothetical protein ACE5HC_01230 [Candidatus Binatia bacterium]